MMTRKISYLGWEIVDQTDGFPQVIFVGYPHTSRWDFVLTQAVRLVTGRRLLTLVIESEFSLALSPWLRLLRCHPVALRRGAGTIDRLIQTMARDPSICLALCPEGQIEWSPNWRSGYYVLSLITGLPVSYVTFDYARRQVTLSEPVQMLGDPVVDLAVAGQALSSGVGYRCAAAGRIEFQEGWQLAGDRLNAQRRLWQQLRRGVTGVSRAPCLKPGEQSEQQHQE